MKLNVTSFIEKFYLRFPPLNQELKETIIKILPILSLLFGILITLASVADLLGGAFITSITLTGESQIFQQLLLRNVIGVSQGLLMIFAFQPLRYRIQKGWRLFFWAQVLWIFSTLIFFSPSFLLGLFILYPLFQVRSYYR